jgi:hypothetical protein
MKKWRLEMSSKYIDPTAIMQIIGCVYNNP